MTLAKRLRDTSSFSYDAYLAVLAPCPAIHWVFQPTLLFSPPTKTKKKNSVTRKILLNTPFLSSPMDTVTETQ
jgi:hypothetical protein